MTVLAAEPAVESREKLEVPVEKQPYKALLVTGSPGGSRIINAVL